CLQSSDWPYIF
nr:immunoglobulin light chain junction region [Macaca mulatta]